MSEQCDGVDVVLVDDVTGKAEVWRWKGGRAISPLANPDAEISLEEQRQAEEALLKIAR